MDLRDYQQDAIEALRASLASGKKRPVVQMPTGAGKTICAAEIVRMARLKGNSVIFTVPAIRPLIDLRPMESMKSA
jgi:DNA repair protein RadD